MYLRPVYTNVYEVLVLSTVVPVPGVHVPHIHVRLIVHVPGTCVLQSYSKRGVTSPILANSFGHSHVLSPVVLLNQ